MESEDCRSKDLFGICIDNYLNETTCFAKLARAPDPGHHPFTHQRPSPGGTNLFLGHADSSKRWIDEQAIAKDSVSDLAWILIEKVCRDDFIVVIRGMRKCTETVDIPDGPDARHIAAQVFINIDKAVLVELDSGCIQPQIICVGSAADC